MRDTLLGVLVLGGILVASALITNWFARAMYNRCAACGTLNARRRSHCRACQEPIESGRRDAEGR